MCPCVRVRVCACERGGEHVYMYVQVHVPTKVYSVQSIVKRNLILPLQTPFLPPLPQWSCVAVPTGAATPHPHSPRTRDPASYALRQMHTIGENLKLRALEQTKIVLRLHPLKQLHIY